jgi:uncharacterized protein YijF (DUF1287 family)
MKSLTLIMAVAVSVMHGFPDRVVQDEVYVLEDSDNPIVMAARKFVESPFLYDRSMGFYTTTFKNGIDQRKFVYPNGDINPNIGVCTDLIVRVFREAGYDLQQLVHEDAKKNFSSYPYANWGMTRPDANIDHRRVPMLHTYFKRHGRTLTIETTPDKLPEWKAGDIVIWDLGGTGKLDHIGIVSDRRLKDSNRPLVIDNFPDPGHVAIGDILNQWVIRAHYRYPR